jgi:hypothetical protein
MKKTGVKINRKDRLFVIPTGSGWSCYGFDNLDREMRGLAAEFQIPIPRGIRKGTMLAYHFNEGLHAVGRKKNAETGWRSAVGLSPQLIGLEGWRVEVVTTYGETRRFIVGKSTGWMPIHLEIARRDSSGGGGAERQYKSVRALYKSR